MTTTVLNIYNFHEKALKCLLGGIVALAVFYCYCVISASLQTAALASLDENIATVGVRVGELESRYLAASSDLDLAYANSLGLAEAQRVSFAARNSFAFRQVIYSGNEI